MLTPGPREGICRRSFIDLNANSPVRPGTFAFPLPTVPLPAPLSDWPKPPLSCTLPPRFGDSCDCVPKPALFGWNIADVGVTCPDSEVPLRMLLPPPRLFIDEFAILLGGGWKFKFAITWKRSGADYWAVPLPTPLKPAK